MTDASETSPNAPLNTNTRLPAELLWAMPVQERLVKMNWLGNMWRSDSGTPYLAADFIGRLGRTVCLVDVRGTGETQPGTSAERGSSRTSVSQTNLILGQPLLGSQLRDLRTVVVAADTAARDEQTRAVAQQLRDGLAARVDGEHGKWLSELNGLVTEGRTVRALRLSSHPPKAGAPLPSDLAERLAALASAGLAPEITQDRWATLVDAAAFSPVRLAVKPVGVPAVIADELKATIARIGARVPQIADLFGITPEAAPARRGPAARARRPGQITGGRARPIPPAPPRRPVSDASMVPVVPAPVADDPPAVDAPVVEGTDVAALVEHTASSDVARDVATPSGEADHDGMAADEVHESVGEA